MREIISGIYCIENVVDNKKYIGQTIDLDRRLRDHKKYLIKNKSKNFYFEYYGEKYNENK